MTKLNDQSARLLVKFKRFQTLDSVRDSDSRKEEVRLLEGQVKRDKLAISSDQIRKYLASNYELARILVHLCIEKGKVNSDPELWTENILSEWELLRRRELSHDVSRMPLYYAVRAYLTRLKAAPDLLKGTISCRNDRFRIREIESVLSKSEIDCNSQLRARVAELLFLIDGNDSSSSDPAITAALISRKGAIISAIIAAVVAIIIGLVTNWDKISSGRN